MEINNVNYKGTGIFIENSKGIMLSGFTISGGLYGVFTQGSSNITIENNHISDVGQEAISIKSGISQQPLSDFVVKDNIILDTGKTNAKYGEGIYIGDGNDRFNEVLHNISIKNNHITNVTNEAIDIKINVKNINIHSNTIIDTNLKFNGAITVATSNRYGDDSEVTISHNLIRGVINRSGYTSVGIAVGQGNAVIHNNVIIENNKKFVGICLYTTFMNNDAKNVTISKNEIVTQGRGFVSRCGSGGTGEKEYANVTVLSDI